MIFLINEMAFFKRICILNIFNPQLDEPEHPPTNIKNKNIKDIKLPHVLKSYVLKPLPVVTDTTLNIEILNA